MDTYTGEQMSIVYCYRCDVQYDMDYHEECPRCEEKEELYPEEENNGKE